MTLNITSFSEQDCIFFEQALKKRFIKSLVDDISLNLPDVVEANGKDNIKALAEYGIEKSKKYGITNQADVSDYVYLMLSHLGVHFDEDPIYMPTHNILNDPELGSYEKISDLKFFANQFIGALFKEDKQFILKMVKYTRSKKLFNLNREQDPFTQVKQDMESHFSDKYSLIHSKGFDQQILITRDDLNQVGIFNQYNQATISGLGFLFGFKIYDNPLMPEINDFLYRKQYNEEEKMTWLSNYIDKKLSQKISFMQKHKILISEG